MPILHNSLCDQIYITMYFSLNINANCYSHKYSGRIEVFKNLTCNFTQL